MINYDNFGPERIIKLYNPILGVKAVLCIDNTKLGPGKGGIRMTETVSEEEVSRLARAMTWKNALAELPFGGAKSGIILDSKKLSREKKKEIVEWFSKANGDMKSCTGKPKHLGGLPHELGSTGFGVYHAIKTALNFNGEEIKGKTVAIEGFGNVGEFVFKFLEKDGAKIVAVSDSKGAAYKEDGMNFERS